jgi:hypothetical protein
VYAGGRHGSCARPAPAILARVRRSGPHHHAAVDPEHLEKYPDLHETFWKASKQASKVKQSLDAAAAKDLLAMIDTIDEMWKATGGPEKTRVNGRPS